MNTPRKEGGIADVTIPLLADIKKEIARDYGVLLPDGVALRGLFVIDPKGAVRHITINDLPIGRSVDEALRVVQAVQFADKHGEVCPAAGAGQGQHEARPEGLQGVLQEGRLTAWGLRGGWSRSPPSLVHLLGQIRRLAERLDQPELRLQPVDMILFTLEDSPPAARGTCCRPRRRRARWPDSAS